MVIHTPTISILTNKKVINDLLIKKLINKKIFEITEVQSANITIMAANLYNLPQLHI